MPIELGTWKLGDELQPVSFSTIETESILEDSLCDDLSLIAPQLMLIGRQVPTDFGKYIDLLAMDAEGNLTVIELKRDRTPREVVAQVLDYASWIQNLSYEQIAEIYRAHNHDKAFEEGFDEAFNTGPPEKLNENHNLVVVATELDPATERIINYLSDNFGVPINAVFFRHFCDGEDKYIARTWLIDPQEAEVKSATSATRQNREPWNGRDYFVNFGDGSADGDDVLRSWEKARRYGFVFGDGQTWIGQTLNGLFPGARVFVMIAGYGYVGVGTVKDSARVLTEFTVDVDGREVPILQLPTTSMSENHGDDANQDLFVRVDWIETVPKDEAYWEKGMYASGHTACRLRNRFTLDRLTQHFELTE